MKPQDKARTPDGKIETIMSVEDSRVITYESARKGNWYHLTKLVKVYWSANLKKYVTIPE
jgi:hypothetical protein